MTIEADDASTLADEEIDVFGERFVRRDVFRCTDLTRVRFNVPPLLAGEAECNACTDPLLMLALSLPTELVVDEALDSGVGCLRSPQRDQLRPLAESRPLLLLVDSAEFDPFLTEFEQCR